MESLGQHVSASSSLDTRAAAVLTSSAAQQPKCLQAGSGQLAGEEVEVPRVWEHVHPWQVDACLGRSSEEA